MLLRKEGPKYNPRTRGNMDNLSGYFGRNPFPIHGKIAKANHSLDIRQWQWQQGYFESGVQQEWKVVMVSIARRVISINRVSSVTEALAY
jgi:hypothetical protein